MGTILSIVTLVLVFTLVALSMILGGISRLIRRESEATGGEDARLIQEMHHQLNRLEHRIETLETVVTSAGKTTSHSSFKDTK